MHGGKLHAYLQADKFHARMGLPATPWDDLIFAQKGDLHRNQAVIIEWKADYFRQLNQQLLVPTTVTIDATLAAQPELELLGPYAQAEDGTELIKVRRTCFIPPRYVPFFLREPLTPREAWERVRGQVVLDGLEGDCHAMVKYLQAALTRPADGADPLLNLGDPPTAPLADGLLLDHRQRVLEEDFPQLNQQFVGAQQDQVAARLGELVSDNRRAREQERADKEKAKSKDPVDLLGEAGLQKLLRWSHAETSTELQAIWRELANAKKAQQLAVLQWAVDKAKEEMGEPELQFVVSPAHLEMVKNLRFTMLTPNHVATGLQPFQFPEEALDGATAAQSMYEALYAGVSAPPMADLALVIQSKPGAPRAIYQARHQVRRVGILLGVLLGEDHQLTRAYDHFYQRFMSAEADLHRYQQSQGTAQEQLLFPTRILKRNAIDLSYWFEMQSHTPAIRPPPRFQQLFEDIKQELTTWEPQMSLSFLKELKLDGLSQTPYVPNATPTPTPRPAPDGGPLKPPGDDATASNPYFWEATFGTYRKLTSVKTRAIRRKIVEKLLPVLPLSKVDGQPMCLAWHSKGQCNVRCPRAADHVAYTHSELGPLAAWCSVNYPSE
jgi:hypothetical protein